MSNDEELRFCASREVSHSGIRPVPDILLRVLMVEDCDLDVALYRDVARHIGTAYHLDVVKSGEEALQLIQEHHYDVFLIDRVLPGMHGCELSRRLREYEATRHTIQIGIGADFSYGTHPSLDIVLPKDSNPNHARRVEEAFLKLAYKKRE